MSEINPLDPPPEITNPGPAPTRNNRDEVFAEAANAFLGRIPPFADDLQAALAWFSAVASFVETVAQDTQGALSPAIEELVAQVSAIRDNADTLLADAVSDITSTTTALRDDSQAARDLAQTYRQQAEAARDAVAQLIDTLNADPNAPLDLNIEIDRIPAPASASYAMDDQGRINTVTETVGTDTRVTELTYNDQDLVTEQRTTFRGAVRTETYSYDDNGNITALNAVEAPEEPTP